MKYKNNITGVLLVNKPKGITSRDVVNEVQKLLNTKAGHTGTLDPMAEGVLVVCLGKATKLTEIITSAKKEYIAEVILGIETDTLDTEGKVLKEENTNINKTEIEKALNNFTTTYNQEVPKYSAVKVNGKKLYEYARKGEEITLPKKEVTVYQNELLSYKVENNKTIFTFKTKVSKGTYIRSLIRDISHHLNTIGTMSKLTRTVQGKFTLKECYTLDDIKKKKYKILPIKEVLDIEVKQVSNKEKNQILNGVPMDGSTSKILFVDENGKELAIYQKVNSKLKMWKMLYENNQ